MQVVQTSIFSTFFSLYAYKLFIFTKHPEFCKNFTYFKYTLNLILSLCDSLVSQTACQAVFMLCKLSTEQYVQQGHQQTRQIRKYEGCLCIKYEIKERFCFLLHAFNQKNGYNMHPIFIFI